MDEVTIELFFSEDESYKENSREYSELLVNSQDGYKTKLNKEQKEKLRLSTERTLSAFYRAGFTAGLKRYEEYVQKKAFDSIKQQG